MLVAYKKQGASMRYLVVLLLLCGCASQEEINARTDQAFIDCAGIFKPGTAEHYGCVKELVMGSQPRRAPQQTTDCKPDGYGGVRCVTR